MDPVLGGEVVESQQFVDVVGDLLDGLGELRTVCLLERGDGLERVVAVLGGGVHGGGLSGPVEGLLGLVCGARHRALLKVGGPIPPFTFCRFGFRLSCDAGLEEPLRRDRIVVKATAADRWRLGGGALQVERGWSNVVGEYGRRQLASRSLRRSS
ncbi:hypothetical protein [Streptomyces sp. SID161]|uniref:hypothetical protein n=1 Tax=Streptomyces sp. SID161 TaxID=2690251 RepID=UPI00136C3D36|nr:hypothetical protein [Streptomyces sp. SID161]MYW47288.1 hypothetical protein [Streptomyces sp. SID161]